MRTENGTAPNNQANGRAVSHPLVTNDPVTDFASEICCEMP